ncbi:MAG TPA: prolipoprotein diacylglyceryl transferase [Chloroflexia bacterium]|nr:prolipoprotein diacylglyceryl transferase [Chloroflexia bacterium]
MPPSPIIVQLGPLALRWYSVMIVLGALVAAWIATREARRRGQDSEIIWQMLPIVLVCGIIGARLGWVLVSLKDIQAKGWDHAFYVWEGGLSIQGALVGGILAAVIYTRRQGLDFFEWADIIIPGVAIAQAIGRWGNYFNQEAFGAPCNNPWCIPISPDVLASHPEYAAFVGKYTHFAPTFAYEMIWDLLNFALLMWLGRQWRVELRTGDLLWVYGIFYSIGRFFIEEIRVDSATVNGLKAPELFALLTIVVCWAGLIWRHRPGSTAPVAVVADEDAADAEADAETEWEAEDGVPGAADAVDHDEQDEPVEPVPHAQPVVAQAAEAED